jgi:hypothetical protein
MKLSHALGFGALAAVGAILACTSSTNPQVGPDAGTTSTATGGGKDGSAPDDATAGGSGSGNNGDGDSGSTAGGNVGDATGNGNGNGTAGDGGGDDASTGGDGSVPTGSCATYDGSWSATQVKCNGTPITLPPGFSWASMINGAQGSFTTTINGCALTNAGAVACGGGELLVTPATSSCNPSACATFGAACSTTDTREQVWTMSAVTTSSFVLTSADGPDGGPSPITTCTSQNLQNPVEVTWTKQGP